MAEKKGRFYRAMGPVKVHSGPALFTEDFSKPCGLPFGTHSVELGKSAGYGVMDSVKPDDLYKGVQKNLKEDSNGVRSLTKPHNW